MNGALRLDVHNGLLLSAPWDSAFDAAQLGKEVQQRCQLSDPSGRLGLCLTEQCRFAQKDAGATDEQIAERMSSAWLLLQSSGHKLEYAWGAEKFFGEGRWKNSAGWPWKQGMAPQPKIIYTPDDDDESYERDGRTPLSIREYAASLRRAA